MRGARLGPFVLDAPLARGAMGEVWQATHAQSGRAVAVKVMLTEAARGPILRQAIEQEVWAMARLHHPNIVAVLDHGLVEEDVGALVPGSPFVAMELVHGPSLRPSRGTLGWPTVQRLLLELLSALAHAHARGVLHRDLKPSNVLLDPNRTVRLTDFGLARALDGSVQGAELAGTPRYMAPEQRAGRWRDYGRWTDLFALGRLCEALLEPDTLVPEGLLEWLARMTAVRPVDRFRTAPDAAWVLEGLGPAEVPLDIDAVDAARSGSSSTISLTGLFDDLGDEAARSEPVHDAVPVRPFCEDWRRALDIPLEPRLQAAGLGLIGLRAAPLQGRGAERDHLWDALRRVHRTGAPVVVSLEGPAGIGKSRLAEWLCQRALELGAGLPMVIRHDRVAGPEDGIDAALARLLGTVGLGARDLVDRVRRVAESWELHDLSPEHLAALVHGDDDGALPVSAPVHRHPLRRALLSHLARERPLVLWVDDAQWGGEALGFLSHLRLVAPLPVLAVLTIDPDRLGAQAARRLAELEPERLLLEPLPARDQRTLIHDLLGLEPALEDELLSRTREPADAVQLVRELVDLGALRPGPDGFVLKPGFELPSPSVDRWRPRVQRFLRRRTAADRTALELAAVCGPVVVEVDWRRTCALTGIEPPPDLVDSLVRTGLAQLDGPGRWRFVHGQIRAVLRGLAEEGSRLAAHHALRVRVLEASGHADAGTLGEHLAHAGARERALAVLRDGAREAAAHGDAHRARALGSRREQLVAELALPEHDRRRGEGAILDAILALNTKRTQHALAVAEQTLALTERHGWEDLRHTAAWLVARVKLLQGRVDEARPVFERYLAWGEEHGDAVAIARGAGDLGRAWTDRGGLAEAEPLLLRSYEAYGHARFADGQGFVAGELADLTRQLGRLDESERWVDEMLRLARQLGNPADEADAWTLRGEIWRARGHPDEAEACYRRAMTLLQLYGAHQTEATVALNLAMLLEQRDELHDSLRLARRSVWWLAATGRIAWSGLAHAVALPAAAGLGDRSMFDGHLQSAEELLAAHPLVHSDLALVFERAAARARAQGWADRVERLERLLETQRSALGRRSGGG